MNIPNKIVRNILGDKVSKQKRKTAKEELIEMILKRTSMNKVDAESVAGGLIRGDIPYLNTDNGRIEVK